MPHFQNRYRFALVSHSKEIVNTVRKHIDHETEELFSTIVELDDAVSVSEALIKDGYEVIIGHGGTGGMIAKNIGQPVVNIPMDMLDIITALLKARKSGDKIGITSLSKGREGFETLRKILMMDVQEIVFNNQKELQKGVDKAIGNGVNVIVGGGVSRRMASRLNVKTILIEPGEQIIQDTIKQARALAAARRKETEHHERLKTIMNIMDDGMICVDSYGYLNSYNRTAEIILGMDLNAHLGKSVSDFTSSFGLMDVFKSKVKKTERIIKLKDNDIVVSSFPIQINDRVRGAVSLFKEGNVIHGMDRKLRERIYQKGFIAKYQMKDILSINSNMQNLITKAKKFAKTEASILVYGETGTGKELLSHALHNDSQRKKAPFVAINCAALSETLLETELFGYEEGAFTGAKKGGKIGLFELANNGTIFLDEIGDISSKLQVRLLRILESKEVIRVGGDRVVPVDVRIISSTHKDLCKEVRVGRFRKDLFYRLAVLRLNIPPLRHRPQDIPVLLVPLLKRYGKSSSCVTPDMLTMMQSYWWPGNIRELNALMENYLILLGTKKFNDSLFMELFEEYKDQVRPEDSTGSTKNGDPSFSEQAKMSNNANHLLTLSQYIEAQKIKIANYALQECGNNRTLAAKKLGISTSTFWRILNPKKMS